MQLTVYNLHFHDVSLHVGQTNAEGHAAPGPCDILLFSYTPRMRFATAFTVVVVQAVGCRLVVWDDLETCDLEAVVFGPLDELGNGATHVTALCLERKRWLLARGIMIVVIYALPRCFVWEEMEPSGVK